MKSIGTFLLFCSVLSLAQSSVRFTNFKCKEFDPGFATFEKCILKVVGRGIISLNMHTKLLQVPVPNVSLAISLHKKLSGYRPFLYSYNLDFCKFQANPKKYPVVKLFFDTIRHKTNINHTCPFDHDIIVDNLILDESMFNYFPLPLGEYMFMIKVGAYNDWKADIRAYLSITSDFGGN